MKYSYEIESGICKTKCKYREDEVMVGSGLCKLCDAHICTSPDFVLCKAEKEPDNTDIVFNKDFLDLRMRLKEKDKQIKKIMDIFRELLEEYDEN